MVRWHAAITTMKVQQGVGMVQVCGIWHGTVWYGMVWYGRLWDPVWYVVGMVYLVELSKKSFVLKIVWAFSSPK